MSDLAEQFASEDEAEAAAWKTLGRLARAEADKEGQSAAVDHKYRRALLGTAVSCERNAQKSMDRAVSARRDGIAPALARPGRTLKDY